MRDPNRAESGVDFPLPIAQKIEQGGEIRRKILFLPDEDLQERMRIWPETEKFRSRQPSSP